MVRRLAIVLLLMLFPLQWSVAQGHELRDDAGMFASLSAGDATAAGVAAMLVHNDEPGGICQFHELAQPSVLATADDPASLFDRALDAWKAGRHLTPPGSGLRDEIYRPKWSAADPSAANSRRRPDPARMAPANPRAPGPRVASGSPKS